MSHGFLRNQQQAKHIKIKMLVEVFGGDVVQGRELVETRVVDEDVDHTERLDGLSDHGFHLVGVGEIAMDSDGFASLAGDGRHHAVRSLPAGTVVDGNRGTLSRKTSGDFGTDAL